MLGLQSGARHFGLLIKQLNWSIRNTRTHAEAHTNIPRQITWTFKPLALGTFQHLPLMSKKFSVCLCVCMSVTTGPFIKVLALHLPWGTERVLAAPGKNYCLCPLFFTLFKSLSFLFPSLCSPLLSAQLISTDFIGIFWPTSPTVCWPCPCWFGLFHSTKLLFM